ncbi:MAG: hypothetical protein JWR14_4892 [Caballeronia sp.]|nr:hypothetical protein [Caballeronia sp.]
MHGSCQIKGKLGTSLAFNYLGLCAEPAWRRMQRRFA